MQEHLLVRKNFLVARRRWGTLPKALLDSLTELTRRYCLSVSTGDIILLNGTWYLTHSGLMTLARRSGCRGIHVEPVYNFCVPSNNRWAFKATVFRYTTCRGFEGFGDADPSNILPTVRGSEMRIAETRAVNRALRKAYGIGICSVEELGSTAFPASTDARKMAAQSANESGNYGGPRLRDRLCQLIRQHRLDANLVKSYAIDFCGTKSLRDASREQVEAFVAHLADWARRDRNALLCQLNNYLPLENGRASQKKSDKETKKKAGNETEGEKQNERAGAA